MAPGMLISRVEFSIVTLTERMGKGMDLLEVEAIAERELRKHGLKDWTFAWARTKRRQGACKFRERRIEIAEFYAKHNPPEKVLDTLLHEIAHALAGPKARHGPVWKAIASKLGATPQACDTCYKTVVMPGDWQATCDACGKTFHRYKRPQHLAGYRCRCAARQLLVFQYMGDPARKPAVELTIQQSARWEATCAGCQTVHRRIRKPKPGNWHCKCPHRCRIVWQLRTSSDSDE